MIPHGGPIEERSGEYLLRKVWVILCVCFPFVAACDGLLSHLKPPLENEGEVYLYVQAFPQEAERLRFKIEAISARKSDGAEFPFSMKLSELTGREMTRQRLLGVAHLPPGTFVGLSVKIKEARLRSEEGEAALLVPEAPIRVDYPFNVSRKRGYVIWLMLRPVEYLRGGSAFAPGLLSRDSFHPYCRPHGVCDEPRLQQHHGL